MTVIGRPELVAGVIMLALNVYVLTGGADFGGGVWDLLSSGPRRHAQRDLIAGAIAPIWEANHVWLIVAVVLSFTAFPRMFGAIATVLHLPLALMLLGIVLRGSAFVFRSYGARNWEQRRRWGRAFAIASLLTPLFLGAVIGAVASGAAGTAYARVGTGTFADVYVRPWLSPFAIAIGGFALALFALLAAVYLTVEARDDALREDFRRRALVAAGAVFIAAFAALALTPAQAPAMHAGLVSDPRALPFHLLTAAAALATIGALWVRRYAAARVAVAAQASLILWGWGLAQFPYLLPPTLTIRDAAAPARTLSLVLWILAGGAVILVPSLALLLRTFAGQPTRKSSSDRA
jgi:cytochrome d ubiquinol oxidase subunit II